MDDIMVPGEVSYVDGALPYRRRVLVRYCSVHIGERCEMGERFADAATEVTAEWLEEMAENLRDAPPTDVARFLNALAREIRR